MVWNPDMCQRKPTVSIELYGKRIGSPKLYYITEATMNHYICIKQKPSHIITQIRPLAQMVQMNSSLTFNPSLAVAKKTTYGSWSEPTKKVS